MSRSESVIMPSESTATNLRDLIFTWPSSTSRVAFMELVISDEDGNVLALDVLSLKRHGAKDEFLLALLNCIRLNMSRGTSAKK